MQVSGSLDMQFCFSILFFVLLTFLVTYHGLTRRRGPMARPDDRRPTGDEYAAHVEQLKASEKEG